MTLGTSIFGLLSLIFTIALPVSLIFLMIWINQIKRNSETQVEKNKEIIRLLNKENTQ
ncbi:MAG TPA: hypothetical protein GX497_00120 [Bacillus bacterium]|nr:hypothetical protein [Bacillus sp. (in: firmicutes)]